MRRLLQATLALAALVASTAHAFDHRHQAWTTLLKRHVVWLPGGHESRVSYSGILREKATLKSYLESVSAVSESEFGAWPKARRLAFLINAYNAYTVDLVTSRYPDLKSIRDLGSVLSSPWKKRFFTLLGQSRSLDDIEHGMIRAKGAYDDPRIHMAVNCAAIGCPALRDEAYVDEQLDQQLEDQVQRFVSDRQRNRYSAQAGALEVSKIFDWYGEDFGRGYRGWSSVKSFFAQYASLLSDDPSAQGRVREMRVPVKFLDYDWALNGVQPR
jgi:hypothetical protein